MKSLLKAMLLFVSTSLLLVSATQLPAQTQAADQHKHEGHAASVLSLDHGNKWETDAPLRKGMQNIDDEVMKSVQAYHDKSLTRTDAENLGRQINKQVAYIVENCKLEPRADAVLHALIGDLLNGTEHLTSDPLSEQGMPVIVKTLRIYPDYFEHPGWGN
jgi:hypothetical protein